jgi:hypothetical protein
VLAGIIFGFLLPLMTAGLLFRGALAATRGLLRVTRTWPSLNEWIVAILGLNSFATTIILLYIFFVLASWFWGSLVQA